MKDIDLFEALIRFFAIKPLNLNNFNLEQAKSIIQKEKKGSIAFTGDHGYFENVLEVMARKIAKSETGLGIVYIYLKGDHCTDRIKRILLEMIFSVKKIIIIGTEDKWQLTDPKIEFVNNEGILKDNHQRFLIYQSPSYSLSLVARKNQETNKIEAAMTNDTDAVSLLSQKIGLNVYRN